MSKYGAQAVRIDGHRFASKREGAHYCLLMARAAAGEIAELELQPRYPLVVNGVKIATYVADFRYREGGARRLMVVDVKGVRTPVYSLKKKLMKAIHDIDVQEV